MYMRRAALFVSAAIILIAIIASSPAPLSKPYTIMIYMNGSDLETDFAAGTTDLIEMLESGLDSSS